MKPEHLELQSADGCQLNLDALYQIAPSCFTEAKGSDGKTRRVVNFDVLRQLLGDAAADSVNNWGEEFYQFTWPGKAEARREAARPIKKTLRPVVEDSVDWDTTQNLYIEGDNLEVLKLLQKSYLGKVKMIYIDPPYNTGNDFVYDDDFAQSASDYAEASGDVDALGNRYRRNTDSNGRFHSDWCSMIYPRLQIARSLLTEDGVIFISIDDNEVESLRKICDEIFGKKNFIAEFPRVTKRGGKSTDTYAKNHDYIVAYCKNTESLTIYGLAHCDPGFNKTDDHFNDRGAFKLNQTLDYDTLGYIYSLDFPIEIDGRTFYPGSVTEKEYQDRKNNNPANGFRWRWSPAKVKFGLENDWLVVSPSGRIYTKTYLNASIEKDASGDYYIEYKDRTKALSTVEFTDNKYSNDNASKELKSLFNSVPFDYVKPTSIGNMIAKTCTDNDSIILDFFSGSATTAHAVMQLNAEDRGKRRFIMVQLPEETEADSEARKAGYANICEIGKERIRRAGKKVKEEAGLNGQDLDIGFRVFRVDESNMEDVYFQPNAYSQDRLDMLLDNIKADRTDLDLLFGAMLEWGLQLSLPMATKKVKIEKLKVEIPVYVVNEGDLVACFSENISEEVIKFISEQSPLRVLLRDSCFSSDADKINIFEQFKQRLGWSDEEAYKNIRVI